MNINAFFLIISALLVSIYLFFKPIDIQLDLPDELAQLELNQFVVHEYDTDKLKTILSGSEGKRYEERYEVKDVNYTNNTDRYVENMRADYGFYKEPLMILKKNVHYQRDDGSRFFADHVTYNDETSFTTTDGSFKLWNGHDSIKGQNLSYNSQSGEINATAITGIYFMKESM